MSSPRVHVVGAGLAGSEAAFFLAERGISVILHEMRPKQMTEAHTTPLCAELVCSNSMKSKSPQSAPGILKSELARMGSIILKTAQEFAVPGGESLTVDRHLFAEKISQLINHHPRIQLTHEEVTEPIPNEVTLFATGPLTSAQLARWIQKTTDAEDLYFYDAIAPIVDAASIDLTRAFFANRWDKGEEVAYLNCPLSEPEYYAFIDALLASEKVLPRSFEKEKYFQGCQPIEAIAEAGRESLRFGPMKPVGLFDPNAPTDEVTGSVKRPYAVVQLRPENQAKSAYNLVGFQTRLKYGEQGKVFRMIPALHQAEFLRYGSIHRNTYLCSPKVLRGDLSLKKNPLVYFAGQVTGVEGYLESTACGILAATFILQRLQGRVHSPPPVNTALGALLRHIVAGNPDRYDPTNIHFGLFEPYWFEGIQALKRDESRKVIAMQTQFNFLKWWDRAL